jgi:hypothetical protein
MNDDDFEKKLHALTGALQRPDPTPAWKADILARARREADASPVKHTLPPHWLMLSWAVAWAGIIALHFTSPRFSASDIPLNQPPVVQTQPPQMITPAKGHLPAVIAFHSRLNLNLDLP